MGGEVKAFGIIKDKRKFPIFYSRYVSKANVIRRERERTAQSLRVLDIGCMDGSVKLFCPFPGLIWEGIDIKPEYLKIAKERGYEKTFAHDATAGIPYKSNTFDILICSHFLEHVQKPEDVIKEAYRVLKKGGIFIVESPNAVMPFFGWFRRHIFPLFYIYKRYRKEYTMRKRKHINFFTFFSLKKLLKSFKIEEGRGMYIIRASGFFLEDYKWWFNLNACWGKLFPWLSPTVQFVGRK